MSLEHWTEKLMGMDDATWRKHANPWSGWTRMPVLPLLALAIWSRVWIGPWAWLPFVACILWVWFNPRVFREPKTHTAWMTRAVLGERLWMARKTTPIPTHHRTVPLVLNALAAPCFIVFAVGLYQLNAHLTLCGLALVILLKFWFLDRMVWLHYDTTQPPNPS